MPHNRLKLVAPDNGAAAADGSTEPAVATATRDPGLRRLRLVESEEAPFPDDAA
jgi:hypothetical protein